MSINTVILDMTLWLLVEQNITMRRYSSISKYPTFSIKSQISIKSQQLKSILKRGKT